MPSLHKQLEKWREYNRISEAGQIARRAFANNSFDGILTMIGVVMGNFVVGVDDAKVVLVTGLSTALAIGISGGWGAYLTESAERRHEIDELGLLTLTDLHDTKIGRASRMAVGLVAAVDGLSPFLAALLVVIPFFFAPLLPSVAYAFYASIGMALLSLFALGVYLGNISKENLIMAGVKTTIAGLVCIALTYFLEQISRM
ncbi:MAG: VIT1/CCC1 transporter family protein [Anaerolineae bacterium]|nr:VIT1/CCC1 transporter family protein [Anaerolineae bacterium]